jgi:hypothetical protein
MKFPKLAPATRYLAKPCSKAFKRAPELKGMDTLRKM